MAKAKKRDMREGMWEKKPVSTGDNLLSDRGTIADFERGNDDIVRPDSKPQADGQATHE